MGGSFVGIKFSSYFIFQRAGGLLQVENHLEETSLVLRQLAVSFCFFGGMSFCVQTIRDKEWSLPRS